MDAIKVYGADWCEDTAQTLEHLRDVGVPYEYIDVDENADAQSWVKRQNDGEQKTPTVDLGGLVLSVPSDGELDIALRRKGLLA